jgi:hypothetical protein
LGAYGTADDVIDQFAARHGTVDWLVARTKAEIRLEARSESERQEASLRLEKLGADERLPPVHRAEVLFNLALLNERHGDPARARAGFAAALLQNPFLELASRRLAAMSGDDSH